MHGGVTWGSLSSVPVVVAAAVAYAAVVVAIYRPQVRRSGWLWRWCVPGFRVAAVTALLGSTLKPSIWRPIAPGDLGEVVVVLDDSPTMGVKDSSWTPTELVGLVQAAHSLPPGVVRWGGGELEQDVARIRPLIDEAARAAGEAEYARLAGRAPQAATARATKARSALVAATNALAARAGAVSEPLKAVLAGWSDVAALINKKGQAAWAELRGRADATAGAIDAYQANADAALYAGDARVRRNCDALAGLSRIDLARRVVSDVLIPALPPGVPVRVVVGSDDQADRARHVRATLLFTDGRREMPIATAAGASVIACRATPAVVRDIALARVAVPTPGYAGQDSVVHVELRGNGYPGASVALTVTTDGGVGNAAAKLDGGAAVVDVPVRFDRAGVTKVTVTATPLAGEATALNNAVDRYVRVTGKRVQAVAFAARNWSALDAALSRVPGLSVKMAGDGATAAPETIVNQQVIILDDVAAGALTGEELDAVHEAVAVRGAALILVAGRSHWPLDAESEAVFDEYLPYRAAGGPVWRVGSGRVAKDDAVGIGFAAVNRYLQLGELRDGVNVLVGEPETGAPLVTQNAVGRGHVFTVAVDDIDGRTDPAAATRFWTGLIRQAATMPYAVERDGYALDADRADAGPGDVVNVRVKVPPGRGAARDPSLLVTAGTRVVRAEALAADGPASDGRFLTTLVNLPAGDYVLRLDTGIDDELAPVLEMTLRVRSDAEAALADVSADVASLARVGEVVPIADAARLAGAVTRVRDDRPRATEYALWDSPYLFLFVTACLTTEWALRKRLGLA